MIASICRINVNAVLEFAISKGSGMSIDESDIGFPAVAELNHGGVVEAVLSVSPCFGNMGFVGRIFDFFPLYIGIKRIPGNDLVETGVDRVEAAVCAVEWIVVDAGRPCVSFGTIGRFFPAREDRNRRGAVRRCCLPERFLAELPSSCGWKWFLRCWGLSFHTGACNRNRYPSRGCWRFPAV